eukprot:GHVN01050839.1.p1 GENE.GHVN01050839.1~~GHVN01050839.1.p1  ORF type:complete len:979 (+),score=221.71 GHVN01050839.1:2704-5640(+)
MYDGAHQTRHEFRRVPVDDGVVVSNIMGVRSVSERKVIAACSMSDSLLERPGLRPIDLDDEVGDHSSQCVESGEYEIEGDDLGDGDNEGDEGDEGEGSEQDQDYTESDDEGQDGYKKGGYHPIRVGEIYNNRYRVEAKLGWGHFSTVWLATDLLRNPPDYVAIKFQKSAAHYVEAAFDEIDILNSAKNNGLTPGWQSHFQEYAAKIGDRYPSDNGVVEFREHFEHVGPNGRHVCMVFQVMGPNLLSLIKRFNFKGVPLDIVRRIAVHILVGLDYLHTHCHIIHTDLKPENVLMCAKPLPKPRPVTDLRRPEDILAALRQQCASLQSSSGAPGRDDVSGGGGGEDGKASEDEGESVSGVGNQRGELSDEEGGWRSLLPSGTDPDTLTADQKRSYRKKAKKKRQKAKKLKADALKAAQHSNLRDPPLSTSSTGVPSSAGAGRQSSTTHDDEMRGSSQLSLHQKMEYEILNIKKNDINIQYDFNPNIQKKENNLKVENDNDKNNSNIYDNNGSESSNNPPFVKHRLKPSGSEPNLLAFLYSAGCGTRSPWDNRRENKQGTDKSAPIMDFNVYEKISDCVADEYIKFSIASRQPAPHHNGLYACLFPQEFTSPSGISKTRLLPLTRYSHPTSPSEQLHDQGPFLPRSSYGMSPPSTATTHDAHHHLTQLDPLNAGDTPTNSDIQNELMSPNGSHYGQAGDGGTSTLALSQRSPSCTLPNLPPGLIGSERLLSAQALQIVTAAITSPTPPLLNTKFWQSVVFTSEGPVELRPSDEDMFNEETAEFKIADLGNACWRNRHFSEDIQTRQYRSPEVIVGAGYDTSADMWSFACMVFELITGDYLFDPKSSETYTRDEDHLALIIELLGAFPQSLTRNGKHSKNYFTKNGALKNISDLKLWGLREVLEQKYRFPPAEAANFSDFLLPMLELDPQKRSKASDVLLHPWLQLTGQSQAAFPEDVSHIADVNHLPHLTQLTPRTALPTS